MDRVRKRVIRLNCKNCIHKDICYKIEHYGRDLESEEPCEEFVSKMICLNHIDEAIHKFDEAIHKFNDLVMKNEKVHLSNDEIDYVVLFNLYFAEAIMNDMSISDVKVLAQTLLAENTKNDSPQTT